MPKPKHKLKAGLPKPTSYKAMPPRSNTGVAGISRRVIRPRGCKYSVFSVSFINSAGRQQCAMIYYGPGRPLGKQEAFAQAKQLRAHAVRHRALPKWFIESRRGFFKPGK